MITAAAYEQMMKTYKENINAPLSAEKAVMDTIEVLKQFGYEAGAIFFEEIVYETVRGTVINNIDV